METFDREMFHDYVVAHGFGPPTEQGYAFAEDSYNLSDGLYDYATLADEVVYRGYTTEPK